MVAAMIAGILPSFRRTAMIADRAVTTRVLAEAARERLIGEAKSLRLMAGLLHDAVAHALRACALPPESISQLHVASQCREAVRVLDVAGHRREPPSSDLVAMVAAVVDGLSLSVAVTGAQIADPPPAVKAALAGAVGEALRNVEKHAGVTSAAVSIGPWLDTRAGVQIVVSDLGVGFDAGGVDDRRFGIRISLQQRLDDVGARCDIESGPGSGTTVRISWRPHPRTASASGLVDLAGTRLSIVQAGATPILIGALIGLSLHPGRLAEPIAVIATAVVVGVQIAAVVAVRWFAPGRLWAAVVGSVLLGGLWLEASAWHWYGGSGTTYGLAALICPGLALLAFYRPYPETWLTLAAVTGSLAWLMSGTQPGQQWLVPSLATIFSPAVAVVAVVMVRSRIDRIGPVVVQSEAAETTAQAERAQLAALRQVGERRIRHIRAQVRPYLAAVINGTVNLRDASVRDRAAALEAAVRDDLQLGSALNPRTREVIEKARLRGATIEFNINTNGVHDYEPLLSSFVAVALSAVPQRLVFSATMDAARAMVSITALLTQAKWTDQVTAIVLATGGTARRTGDLLLLCVTGCGADPLPPLSRDVGTGAQSPADLKLGG